MSVDLMVVELGVEAYIVEQYGVMQNEMAWNVYVDVRMYSMHGCSRRNIDEHLCGVIACMKTA